MRPKDGRVVSNFIVQALTKKSFNRIWRWSLKPEAFVMSDDLVRGIVSLLDGAR